MAMAPSETESAANSHLHLALGLIGDRWTLLIVHSLLGGARRFNELMAQVEGIAPNILTKRLRQLENDSIVVSVPYSKKPLRLEYRLTEPGRELASALDSLASWGARQVGAPTIGALHAPCGTAVELRAWCPTCNRFAELDDHTSNHLDWV
jgi:DNA-binding HxlR family transcriptional regulator